MKRPRLSSFLCLVVAALFSACATEPNLFTVVTVTPPAAAIQNGPTTLEPTTALPFPHNIVLPDQYRYAKILDLPDPKVREVVAKDLKSTLQANGFSDETISLFDLGGLAIFPDPTDAGSTEVAAPIVQDFDKVDFTDGKAVGLFWDRKGLAGPANQAYIVWVFEEPGKPATGRAEFRNASNEPLIKRDVVFADQSLDVGLDSRVFFAQGSCLPNFFLGGRNIILLCW